MAEQAPHGLAAQLAARERYAAHLEHAHPDLQDDPPCAVCISLRQALRATQAHGRPAPPAKGGLMGSQTYHAELETPPETPPPLWLQGLLLMALVALVAMLIGWLASELVARWWG